MNQDFGTHTQASSPGSAVLFSVIYVFKYYFLLLSHSHYFFKNTIIFKFPIYPNGFQINNIKKKKSLLGLEIVSVGEDIYILFSVLLIT